MGKLSELNYLHFSRDLLEKLEQVFRIFDHSKIPNDLE